MQKRGCYKQKHQILANPLRVRKKIILCRLSSLLVNAKNKSSSSIYILQSSADVEIFFKNNVPVHESL